MASDLMMAGYRVWEALEVSEVLFLCEQHKVDAVVIAPEVEGHGGGSPATHLLEIAIEHNG